MQLYKALVRPEDAGADYQEMPNDSELQ